MDLWIWWLLAAVVFAAGEIATLGFFLGPFAVGALVAALVAAVGAEFVVSGLVFLAVSGVVFASLRPVARRHLKMPAHLRTNTAALIGRTATVVDPVSADGGSVKLEGEVWSARPFDEDETIDAGARVQVMEIRGATALVSE